MSKIDIILLIPLLWGAFKGFKKGLILEIASILALLLGVYGAFKFSSFATPYLLEYLGESKYLTMLSFIIVFATIVLLVFAFGKLLEWMVTILALSLVNRMGGLVIGVFKFAFVTSLLITFFVRANNKLEFVEQETLDASILFNPVSQFTPTVIPIIKQSNLYQPIQESLDY